MVYPGAYYSLCSSGGTSDGYPYAYYSFIPVAECQMVYPYAYYTYSLCSSGGMSGSVSSYCIYIVTVCVSVEGCSMM
jgi:hypothetical protein